MVVIQDCKYFINLRIHIIINTPCELIKCRQQLNDKKYVSMKEIASYVYKSEGIRGLYRGLVVSFHRDFFSFGGYFFIYYKMKDYWKEKGTLSDFKLMLAGGLSGALTWLITYPFDTLKTIIQTNYNKNTLSIKEAYLINVKSTDTKIMGLFKGLGPTLVRGFYCNAVIFYTNEICHRVLDKK